MDITSFILGLQKGKSMGGGSSADVRYVTFIGADGTVLYKKPVAVGDDCVDVAAKGLISTPTKEMTVAEVYTYSGWSMTEGGAASSDALKNVTEDRTVYAAFTATARLYWARFYDDTGALMQESQVAHGTKATPPDTTREGYSFVAWTPSDLTIYGDTDFVGEWQIDEGWLVWMPFTSSALGGAAYGMEYTPDGTRLFVWATDKKLHMFDATVQPYEEIYVTAEISDAYVDYRFNELKISPDGNYIALVMAKRSATHFRDAVKIYSISANSLTEITPAQETTTISSAAFVSGLAFTPDSSKLYVSNGQSYVAVWDTNNWSITNLGRLNTANAGATPYSKLSVTPDGQALILTYLSNYHGARAVKVYDINDGYADITNTYFADSSTGYLKGVACSSDGQYIAFGTSSDTTDYCYDLRLYAKQETGTPMYKQSFYKDYNYASYGGPVFTPDSEVVTVACSNSPYIISAETATGKQLDAPRTAIGGTAYSCAYSPDGTRLAVGTNTAPYVSLYEVRR